MRISYAWLKEFVDFDPSPRQLADDLSMVGIVVETIEPTGEDYILDLDLTTNRPDCLSHFGVAREVAARYQRPLKKDDVPLRESSDRADTEVSVVIDSPKLCSRYCARVIQGVKVATSPKWLAERLEALGIRSINNVVDVTNYVLLELGHPLHAFDLARIQDRRIVVREARASEKLLTLDGLQRELSPGMLLIADPGRPVALAGVMGGADSEIGFGSSKVLLESAWFDPVSVRKTSKALNLHTEASHRFERGADINATVNAIDRAAELIQQLAGGEILRGIVDAYPNPMKRPHIRLRRSRIAQVIGTEIECSFITRLLRDLNFEIVASDTHGWQVQLPTSRLDVEREIDLIEEIARHYGYDSFASTLPAWKGGAARRPEAVKEQTLKQRLLNLGFSETVTYSFVDASENQRFSSLKPVRLRNPLSRETEVMRTSLVPGLLSSFLHNYNRGIKSVRLYEMGRIYPWQGIIMADCLPTTDDAPENQVLGIVASGNVQEKTVHSEARSWNFFDVKGDLEILLNSLSLPLNRVRWQTAVSGGRLPDYYHPAVAAELSIGEQSFGVLGQLHPRICENYKIKQSVFLAEIPLAPWYAYEPGQLFVEEPARYPAVQRDLSIVVDKDIDYRAIESAVLQAGIREIQKCFPFDLYFGEKVPFGKKSVSIGIVYQAFDRTLVEEEVSRYHEMVLNLLQKELGAQLRT
jgi:phenylalanyl-tRNA synthetase beta chain